MFCFVEWIRLYPFLRTAKMVVDLTVGYKWLLRAWGLYVLTCVHEREEIDEEEETEVKIWGIEELEVNIRFNMIVFYIY